MPKRRIEKPRLLDTSLTLRSPFLLSPLKRRKRRKTPSRETLLTFMTVPIVSPHNILSEPACLNIQGRAQRHGSAYQTRESAHPFRDEWAIFWQVVVAASIHLQESVQSHHLSVAAHSEYAILCR